MSKSRVFVLVLVRNVAVLVFFTQTLKDVFELRNLLSFTLKVVKRLPALPSLSELSPSDSDSRGSFTTVKMGERPYRR